MPLFIPNQPPEPPLHTDIDPVIDTSAMHQAPDVGLPLITDIEGEPWPVTYYHQLRVEGEAARPLDPGLDATQQQYEQISQFRLSVTGDLEYSTDPSNQVTTVTGDGYVYPNTRVPHYGDMFIGHIEAGRAGIFTLTNVTRVSFYKQAAYRVEYKLFSEDLPEYRSDLTNKTVKQSLFDSRRLSQGHTPIIDYQTANSDRYFTEALARLVGLLYETFYHYRLQTFVVEETGGPDYDPWAVAFFNQVIGRSGRFHYPRPIEYEVLVMDEDPSTRPTLWRAITSSDAALLGRAPRSMLLRDSGRYMTASHHRSAAMAGIQRVWMPDTWAVTTAQAAEDPYVVTHNCYRGQIDAMTPLELAVRDVVENRQVDLAVLRAEIEAVDTLTGWALFHRLILLIGLLRITMGVQR